MIFRSLSLVDKIVCADVPDVVRVGPHQSIITERRTAKPGSSRGSCCASTVSLMLSTSVAFTKSMKKKKMKPTNFTDQFTKSRPKSSAPFPRCRAWPAACARTRRLTSLGTPLGLAWKDGPNDWIVGSKVARNCPEQAAKQVVPHDRIGRIG